MSKHLHDTDIINIGVIIRLVLTDHSYPYICIGWKFFDIRSSIYANHMSAHIRYKLSPKHALAELTEINYREKQIAEFYTLKFIKARYNGSMEIRKKT